MNARQNNRYFKERKFKIRKDRHILACQINGLTDMCLLLTELNIC